MIFPLPHFHPAYEGATTRAGWEWEGKKGTNTVNKIKSIFNSQMTILNMTQKI
jgi:hypothetical protein